MERHSRPLGQLLKEMELITEGQIQEALTLQRAKGGALGDILIEMGYITREELLIALGGQRGMEVVHLDETEIPSDVTSKVPATLAKTYKIIPIKWLEEGDRKLLTVAMANPHDINTLDDLKYLLHCDVIGAVASEEAVNRAHEKYYAGEAQSLNQVVAELTENDLKFEELKDELRKKGSAYNVEEMINAAPVVKLLNLILLTAIKAQASDVHFEPFEGEFKVRYRVDGVLYEMEAPPLHLALPLISRVKVLSNLDISETRLPQDGRILLSVGQRPVDLRISTLPTIFGESVVMRVLDRSVVKLDLEKIGLREDDMNMLKNLINLPHGIIIVTGPTGSGKTTTLYSCLNFANDIRWKIITTEDPVEYDLDGIVQCQINDDIGVTYANLLRSILRQDPDTILVGEMRDLETAQIAVEAALTGHVVFSTLHTNDAPSSITRVLDLGVEPFLIGASLEAIVAQRLVRRICLKCKEEIQPTEEMIMELGLLPTDMKNKKFCWGRGCENCNGTGYRGRLAIFEIMLMNDRVKEMVMNHASTDQIRHVAREQGMRTLRESGLLAIFDGHTTIEEVVRETLFAA
ncbi:MAG: Flp pilus assembly complex ATPase component TadA [Planctomycetes bacterium]|nr:Flp pilus assembly complex ATPase component TadA [Planctomycetota bacterium]